VRPPRPFPAVVVLLVLAAAGCGGGKEEPPGPRQYTVTVALGEGVDGHPASGSYLVTAGLTFDYGYRAQEDFGDLRVSLDGQPATEQGSIAISTDHVLAATAVRRIRWKYDTPQAVYYSAPAIGDDGTVYFGTGMYLGPPYSEWRAGELYAVRPDGTTAWTYRPGGPPPSPFEPGRALYSPVIGRDGTIYVQDATYLVHALSPGGDLLWTYGDFGPFVRRDVGQHCPAVGADGTVYVGADGLHALDPATGRRLWHFPGEKPGHECMASPVVGEDGTIYVMIGEDRLYAVRPNGTQAWALAFAGGGDRWEMSFSTPAIGQDGVLYLATEGQDLGEPFSQVYAILPTGAVQWSYPVDGGRFVRASPVVGADGTIYVATKAGGPELDARVIALSPDGAKRWHFSLERASADVYCTPSVSDDGLLYFGSEVTLFYALRLDGTLAWTHRIGGTNWSSPAIASDGSVYVGSIWGPDYAGRLFAVVSASRGYAASPWPRFRHDRRNTGRVGGP
jgi:outer membrane protein assembly factor BamB